MKKAVYSIIVISVLFFSGFFIGNGTDIYFRINKSIDTFGKVYREITLNYVDEINPEEFILAGIKGMLNSLDPYTVYIDESKKKDLDIITKGKYGGIGATVGIRDDKITIVDLIEGYSAQRQGLRIGDVIIKVDSIEINKENYSNLGLYLKKAPGTEIKITIKRETESEPMTFNLVAEEIEIKNLTYFGFYPENSSNAYLKLSGFSRTAGEEIKNALMELSDKREIKSIVLDLRGNPGGLLDAAIDVCEKFLKKKSIIVSVKGRDDIEPKVYYSHEEPVAKEKRLVVLINEGSASASEIVAGAIQDHDRGVILGEKSFGKGLVQTIVPLGLNTSLKLTTARYFTPSGRCIQKIDYSKNSNVFESHTTNNNGAFQTDHKREVFAGGGIIPDTIVSNKIDSYLIYNLLAQGYFFKFATRYYNEYNPESLDNIDSKKLFSEFKEFLNNERFNFKTKSEKFLESLKNSIEDEFNSGEFDAAIDSIQRKIEKIKSTEIDKYADKIIIKIKKELAARISGRKGRILESLKFDEQFNVAYDILNNKELYQNLLNIKN